MLNTSGPWKTNSVPRSSSTNNIDADVHLNMPKERLPGRHQRADRLGKSGHPGTLGKEQVQGIQTWVAMAVERAEPAFAVLTAKTALSEDADIEPGVTLKTKQLEIQLFIENTLRTKVENAWNAWWAPTITWWKRRCRIGRKNPPSRPTRFH